jgi:hypothetical protein
MPNTQDTISREEAQDLITAIASQRDAHANGEAQLSAALAKANRRIAELEKAAQPQNVDSLPSADSSA